MSFPSPPKPLRRPGRLIVARPISTAPPSPPAAPNSGSSTAALDSSGAQLLAAIMPAVRRADDWRIALRICFEEMCGFLASEPAFASLRTVDIYGAGPAAIASRDEIGRQIVGALLEPAMKSGINATDLMIEADAGTIYGVWFEGAWRGKTADLPRLAPFLTYFALAPFVGAEEACVIAAGRGRTG